jgi:hypothetical protein
MITDADLVQVSVTDGEADECFKIVAGHVGVDLHATQLCELMAKSNEAYLEWMARSLSGIIPRPKYKPANNFPDLKVYVRSTDRVELLLSSYRVEMTPTVFAEFIRKFHYALSQWVEANTPILTQMVKNGGLAGMLRGV